MHDKPVVVIPNLNGGDDLLRAIESLRAQSLPLYGIVVDNASTDGSIEKVTKLYPDIKIIRHTTNKGYAGGVNPGFRQAIRQGATYVAPFNDDAIADPKWLERLVAFLDAHPTYGAACCKVLKDDRETLDSTGDYLTSWGLPYPRGRGEVDNGQYDAMTEVFGASGAASLYRVTALQEVGLLDEDFFAYYEDVDLSLRLQLAGWKIGFVPEAHVFHKIGMTSGRIKGFTTLQTMKNEPLLLWKNLSIRQLLHVWPRFYLAYTLFFWRAVSRGQAWPALKGALLAPLLSLKKIPERAHIRRTKKVTDAYIWSIMTHDLPPNAHALRRLRASWWKLLKRSAT